MVEYHFSGFDPKYEGMDWRSLRLVFEEKDNIWHLVGIIHDQWTI
jgi:(p)ppGpp synthase/HD superfamily hydrolase